MRAKITKSCSIVRNYFNCHFSFILELVLKLSCRNLYIIRTVSKLQMDNSGRGIVGNTNSRKFWQKNELLNQPRPQSLETRLLLNKIKNISLYWNDFHHTWHNCLIVINAFLSILDIVYNYTDNQFKLIINRQLTWRLLQISNMKI